MKRSLCLALAAGLMAAVGASPTSAQVGVYVAGGATFPTSDYGDYAKTGWQGTVGFGVPVGPEGLTIGAEGFFGVNNHDDVDGDKTNLYGATGELVYTIPSMEAAAPFFFGGLGFMTHSFKSDTSAEESLTGLAASGGAGVQFPLGSTMGFVFGGYTMGFGDVDGSDIFTLGAGVLFSLGGGM